MPENELPCILMLLDISRRSSAHAQIHFPANGCLLGTDYVFNYGVVNF